MWLNWRAPADDTNSKGNYSQISYLDLGSASISLSFSFDGNISFEFISELGREIIYQPDESKEESALSKLPKADRFRIRYRNAAMIAAFLVTFLANASSVYSTPATASVTQQYYPYSGCYYSPYPTSNAVLCYGYIYQAPNGCTVLVVFVGNIPHAGDTAMQYYTLRNLSSTPPSGTWVRVEGQMYTGYNTSPNGSACPGNYINVTQVRIL